MEGFSTIRMSERNLFSAVESGELHDVKQMLSNLTVNPRDKNGITLLHRAARSGQNGILHYLLSSGRFKPTATDKYGWTALHWAAWCGHSDIVQTMIKMGKSSVNYIDRTGSTPLHLACLQGHEKIVQLLISAKCDINAQRKDNWCGLHLAVWNGHFSVVEDLLKQGANPNEETSDGMGAVHLASKKGFADILQCLLEKGKAAIDMQDKNGNTALHIAVTAESVSVVKVLLDRECRINVRNKLGQTPMDIASMNGLSDIVVLLAGLKHVLPRVPPVTCTNNDDMKALLTTLDANCTIRNSDIRRYSGDSRHNYAGKLVERRLRVDGEWKGKAKTTALGVVANYEQRIREIEEIPKGTGKESPKCPLHHRTRRVPSAPFERTLTHKFSLLSL